MPQHTSSGTRFSNGTGLPCPVACRLTTSIAVVVIVGCVAGLRSSASPQLGDREAPAVRADEGAPSVRRSDLARAYLAFEMAYRDHPPARERVAEVNRAFDRVTLRFFAGDAAQALRSLDELTSSLYPEGEDSLASRIARSWRLGSTPPNPIAASARDFELAIDSLYAVDLGRTESVELEIRVDGEAGTFTRTTVSVTKERPLVRTRLVVPADAIDRNAADIRVQIRESSMGVDDIVRSETIPILSSDPDRVRASNLAFSSELVEAENLGDERSIFAARNELLDGAREEGSAGPVPLDRSILLRELRRERQALLQGEDPYRGIEGHSWRVVSVGSIRVPLRLYVPDRNADTDAPMPLVIALHGAGGDENMFVEGYGAGELCRLADAYGFIVASPQTFAFGSTAEAFDRLVASVRDDYPIDGRRIYLIGHSFGAGVAHALVLLHGDRIAAFSTIAGARTSGTSENGPPHLRIHGGLDPLARGRVDASRTRGRVRDRVFEDYGHTLVVGAALPEVIGWLVAHRIESDG